MGSDQTDSWDCHHLWMMVRIDAIWRIGASLHRLPSSALEAVVPGCQSLQLTSLQRAVC